MLTCLSWSTLCSSRRLPFSVLSFTASCSASSLVWAFPSISKFSLCTDNSDKATTFCSISTSMFCSSKNKDPNSYIFQLLSRFQARWPVAYLTQTKRKSHYHCFAFRSHSKFFRICLQMFVFAISVFKLFQNKKLKSYLKQIICCIEDGLYLHIKGKDGWEARLTSINDKKWSTQPELLLSSSFIYIQSSASYLLLCVVLTVLISFSSHYLLFLIGAWRT